MSPYALTTLSSRAAQLAQSDLFALPPHTLSPRQRIELTYARAKAIADVYELSAHDVTHLTSKFWALHLDNIAALDIAAFSLLTIQYNLVAGALAPHAALRPELRPLLEQVLKFEVSAQFLLTEFAHGLDAPNLETTATLLPSGEFDLHTPRFEACKFMPPSAPLGGLPRVGLVFARLMVGNENRGIRPFIVVLGDGKTMNKGISSRLMPKRAGAKPVDHAVTRFTHVRLPSTALLGSLDPPSKNDHRSNFQQCIARVAVGSLAVSLLAIPSLAISAFIAARYSLRRTVTSPSGEQTPIWSFRTQQLPILTALAQVSVMRAHARWATRFFSDSIEREGRGERVDPRVRGGVAASLKAAFMQQGQESLLELMERIGARGLFEENQIVAIQLESRGACIAEGDTLVLSIRLASELLLGRYALPEPRYPNCLLARHEAGLFATCRALLKESTSSESSSSSSHRGDAFNRLVLPLCRPLVEAIGHRMAYEAAVDSGDVDAPLLALYEAWAVRADGAWYAEHIPGLGHVAQLRMEERACTAAAPYVERYLREMGAEAYAHAPILSGEGWGKFVQGLEVFEGGETNLQGIGMMGRVSAELPQARREDVVYERSESGGGGRGMPPVWQEHSAMLSARL